MAERVFLYRNNSQDSLKAKCLLEKSGTKFDDYVEGVDFQKMDSKLPFLNSRAGSLSGLQGVGDWIAIFAKKP